MNSVVGNLRTTALCRAGLETEIGRKACSHSFRREEAHRLSDINHWTIDLGLDPYQCYASTVLELADLTCGLNIMCSQDPV